MFKVFGLEKKSKLYYNELYDIIVGEIPTMYMRKEEPFGSDENLL